MRIEGDLNLGVCAKKLHDLVTRGEVVHESGNMYARLAKALAYIEQGNVLVGIDRNLEKWEKALDIGEMYFIAGDAKFATGPMVCAVILLDLWAAKCYKHHTRRSQKSSEHSTSMIVSIGLHYKLFMQMVTNRFRSGSHVDIHFQVWDFHAINSSFLFRDRTGTMYL